MNQNEIKCKVTDIEWTGCSYIKVGLHFICKGCDSEHHLYYRKCSELENKGLNIDQCVFNKIHYGYYNPYVEVKHEPE